MPAVVQFPKMGSMGGGEGFGLGEKMGEFNFGRVTSESKTSSILF